MANGKGFTKYDQDKPDFTQLGKFPVTLAALCKHVRYGAGKYGDDNWRLATKEDKKRYLAAHMRHILAYLGGEIVDEESDTCHIIPAITCLTMYYELVYGNAGVDVVEVEQPTQLDLFDNFPPLVNKEELDLFGMNGVEKIVEIEKKVSKAIYSELEKEINKIFKETE